jgi:hypothetical protein
LTRKRRLFIAKHLNLGIVIKKEDEKRTPNMGFCASRGWRWSIGSLQGCAFVRAEGNSIGLLVVTLYFYFIIRLQLLGWRTMNPCLHKALYVGRHFGKTLGTRHLILKIAFRRTSLSFEKWWKRNWNFEMTQEKIDAKKKEFKKRRTDILNIFSELMTVMNRF